MSGMTSNATVADVLAHVVEEERGRSNVETNGLQLVVGEKAVAPWRRVIDCFDDIAVDKSAADTMDGLHVYVISHPSPQIHQGIPNFALAEQCVDSEVDTPQSAICCMQDSRDRCAPASEERFTHFMQKRQERRLRQHTGGSIKSRRRGKSGLMRH